MADTPKTLGKYHIQSVLGQGAMGVVYRGVDPDIERPVAIKVMHPHLRHSQGADAMQQRFRREAKAAARCFHPNIVTVFDLGTDQGLDFIVMELVEGRELKSFLAQGHEFSQPESVYMIVEVLKALEAAHRQGVVHRDIKPGNVILLQNGGVKVADFGVARIDHSDLTVTGHLFGTPVYMCPEGLRGDAVDRRADIYSTGMVLLELLTGQKPLPQQVLTQPIADFLDAALRSERGSRLPQELRGILHRALAQEPGRRFPDARSFLTELERVPERADSELTAMETLAASVSELFPAAAERTDASLWTADLLHKLEVELATYTGPVAGFLIRKLSASSHSPMELVESLARHIDDSAERERFLGRARHCLATGSCHGSGAGHAGGPGAHPPLADTLTPEQIGRLIRALAGHLGPIARQLVAHHARRTYRLDELHAELADRIPNPAERQAFLRAVRS
jgi:serine/threonine-protein kinase